MENGITKTINMVQEILKKCTVEGHTVKLPPGQLDRKLYQDVAKSLELIGGKWKGGKVMGFVFQQDPSELLADIASGEKRNLKKEFQFFGTPKDIAYEMVREAHIETSDIVLEPSAGQGAIINAIHALHPGHMVNYFELMPLNQKILSDIPSTRFAGSDFLKCNDRQWDKIIANPPFAKNQDIDHIRHMYDVLKPGGRIVTISSQHWQYSDNKKEKSFREWLYDDLEASVNGYGTGAFGESGTQVATFLIIIDKPKS